MSAATVFVVERHYTLAQVEQNHAIREMYWNVINLICDAEYERRITAIEAQRLSDEAMLSWFHNKPDVLVSMQRFLQ